MPPDDAWTRDPVHDARWTRQLELDAPAPDDVREALRTGPLPLGLGTPPAQRLLFRDEYYDSEDGALDQRGVWCRIRHDARGRQVLALRGVPNAETAQYLDISFRSFPDIARGDSAVTRSLRALVDPDRLVMRLEVQVERQLRRARWLRWPVVCCELAIDHARVLGEPLGTEWTDAQLRARRGMGPSVDRIADALMARFPSRPILQPPIRRALALAAQHDATMLVQSLHPTRDCVVLLADGDRVGFCRDGHEDESISAFWGPSAGEAGCRQVLSAAFGSSQAQVRCLGTVASRPWRHAIEVWMARRLSEEARLDPRVEWLTLDRAIGIAGSPMLQDWRALAALHLASQSELLREQAVGARRRLPTMPVESQATSAPAVRERFLDADISLLAFNERVLELAQDVTIAPARRLAYLTIVASNLDEFFMVRMGALKRELNGATSEGGPGVAAGLLDALRVRARALVASAYDTLREEVLPALAMSGASLVPWGALSAAERANVTHRFDVEIRPRLTPLAASAAHPFPHVGSTELSLAITLRDPSSGETFVATMSLPASVPRLLPLSAAGTWILIEDVICANVATLFAGMELQGAHAFRVTRSADVRYAETTGTDVLRLVEDTVGRRPFLPVVRLEVERAMPADMQARLHQEFRFEHPDRVSDLEAGDVVVVDGPLGLRGFEAIANALHCAVPVPRRSPFGADDSVFDDVRRRDVLVHLPYDAFEDSVLRFLNDASRDPAVESIKMTLYRTSNPSQVVEALFRARAAGKTVVVFVELTARFDESRNIGSARAMTAAGIHVVYGVRHLKLHAKLMLVLRRDDDGLRSYAYVGSGNFNPVTAQFYTDVGVFTSRTAVVDDIETLMNAMAGVTAWPTLPELLVSPVEMLPRLRALIRREIEHVRQGRPAGIRLKVNGLDEPELVEALYEASAAGVRCHLSVRGICTLRPRVPGLSEHITVISVLGEFLEHARVFHVVNGGADEYFIGSADWRARNLRRRVEVLMPVVDSPGQARLDHLLTVEQEDPGAWVLASDGRWARRARADAPRGTQRRLLEDVSRDASNDGTR